MHSPLERNAVAMSHLRRHGVLGCLLAAVLLTAVLLTGVLLTGVLLTGAGICADLAAAVAPDGTRTAAAPARLTDDAISDLIALAMAARGEDRPDLVASEADGEASLVEFVESEEEIGEAPAEPDLAWLASVRETRPPTRPDPIVEQRRLRLAPTRAPPTVIRTVG